MKLSPELQATFARVRILLMDVDGVLPDGRLFNVPGEGGKMFETKGFDSQDGMGLQWLSWYNIQTGVISGRISPATDERARHTEQRRSDETHRLAPRHDRARKETDDQTKQDEHENRHDPIAPLPTHPRTERSNPQAKIPIRIA